MTKRDYIKTEEDFHKKGKAEIRPEEQSEKSESCWENSWNEMQLKSYKDRNRRKSGIKKEWANLVGLCQRHKPQHPHHVNVSPWGQNKKEWASSVGLCQKHKPQHPHHVNVSPRGRVGPARR